MEAIVLAGGYGTRLNHVVSDVVKPMAPVDGRPFLKYLLELLKRNRINRVVIAVGYLKESIIDYFGDNYMGIEIQYSIENEPLGTGGAIMKALDLCLNDEVFIVNGDTYFDVNLLEMKKKHLTKTSDLTIAIKEMSNFDRYGCVIAHNDYVVKFEEKKFTSHGFINGGIYLINKKIFEGYSIKNFSFETEILENYITNILVFKSEGYFIDIGIPSDYERAQFELRGLIGNE